MRRITLGARLGLLVFCMVMAFSAAAVIVSGQQQGGTFLPTFNYRITGLWTFTQAPIMPTGTSSTSPVTVGGTQTLTNKTLTAPALSGTATGTYTLGGTPTLTAPVIATVTNTGTLTLPNATAGVPVMFDCASTGSGNQTCSPTAAAATTKIYSGKSTLAANAAVITFPVAFTATTNYSCVANDVTTRGNPVQMVPTTAATATITNTTGATDVIQWLCIGQ